MIVSVKKRDGKKVWKGNAKVNYEVVTQTHLALDSNSCNMRRVSDILRKQLNFDVVLLDKKCYPLMENDSTSSESFWKSSPKVLAANKSLYHKVSDESTNVGRASIEPLIQDESSEESHSSGSSWAGTKAAVYVI